MSYQLNSTANPAHLPQNWAKLAKLAVLPGADHSFYVKTIETHARAFLPLSISAIGTVLALHIEVLSDICLY